MTNKDLPLPVLLRDLREVRGLSLSQAAKLAGCTKAHIWDMEQGKAINPTVKMLAGLGRAYGLSPATILREALISQ